MDLKTTGLIFVMFIPMILLIYRIESWTDKKKARKIAFINLAIIATVVIFLSQTHEYEMRIQKNVEIDKEILVDSNEIHYYIKSETGSWEMKTLRKDLSEIRKDPNCKKAELQIYETCTGLKELPSFISTKRTKYVFILPVD